MLMFEVQRLILVIISPMWALLCSPIFINFPWIMMVVPRISSVALWCKEWCRDTPLSAEFEMLTSLLLVFCLTVQRPGLPVHVHRIGILHVYRLAAVHGIGSFHVYRLAALSRILLPVRTSDWVVPLVVLIVGILVMAAVLWVVAVAMIGISVFWIIVIFFSPAAAIVIVMMGLTFMLSILLSLGIKRWRVLWILREEAVHVFWHVLPGRWSNPLQILHYGLLKVEITLRTAHSTESSCGKSHIQFHILAQITK